MQFDIKRLETTGSTNDDAKQAAAAGAPEGAVFWALRQEAGRGRQGRAWVSPPGNLYCSVLLRPDIEPRDFGRFSFVASLAISDVVRALLPDRPVELKWPNDVLVGGKKISGILLESGSGEDGKPWLVIGIGLNVRHMPDNPLYPVTSLLAEKAELPELNILLDQALHFLGNWCEILKTPGFGPIRAAWLDRARKGAMRVRLPQEEIAGRFADLDADGNLLLILPDGTERSIATGDVFF